MIDRTGMYGRSGIQMTGMVSGLDTESIVQELLKVETEKLENTIKDIDRLQLQQEAWSEIREKFISLENSLYNLRGRRQLTSNSANSTNESILTALANNNSTIGNFYVNVEQMASSTRITGSENIKPANPEDIKLSNLGNFMPGSFTFVLKDNEGDEFNLNINLDENSTIADVITQIENVLDTGHANYNADIADLIESVGFVDGRFLLEGSEDLFDIKMGDDEDTSNLSQILRLPGAQIENDSNVFLKSSSDLNRFFNVSQGHITINGVNIETEDNETLNSFINRINNSDANVNAFIDNDKLIIQNKETGPKNLTISGDLDLMQELGLKDTLGDNSFVRESGNESVINVSSNSDGSGSIQLTSWDNSFDYNNVQLNISQISNDDWIGVNVTKDIDSTFNQIKNFIEEYNDLMNFLDKRFTEEDVTGKDPEDMTEEEKMQGVLRGDRRLRSIIEGIKRTVYGTATGETDDFKSLFEIGLRSGDVGRDFENTRKGLLMIDEDSLRNALENNMDGVISVLTKNETESKGIFTQLRNQTRELSKFQGTIHNIHRPQGILDRLINENSRRMENLYRALETRELALYKQFTAMERAMLQMQNQQSYLFQAFQ